MQNLIMERVAKFKWSSIIKHWKKRKLMQHR